MIKTIFVPASGTQADEAVFAAALAVARPLAAHMEFYHLRLSVCEAAVRTRHVQFSAAPALNEALENLRKRDDALSAAAFRHFKAFCETNGVAIRQSPAAVPGISAGWVEETDQAEKHFLFRARYNDLLVLARQRHYDLMPYNFIEWLLADSGRPILIVPDSVTEATGTAVVGWKETPEAVRALAAAMPLLQSARRVVLVGIEEDRAATTVGLEHLARQLAWHGIAAEVNFIRGKPKQAPIQLPKAARDLGADLLVVGGYGHAPLREAVCGGVTRTLIEGADVPVFMVH